MSAAVYALMSVFQVLGVRFRLLLSVTGTIGVQGRRRGRDLETSVIKL